MGEAGCTCCCYWGDREITVQCHHSYGSHGSPEPRPGRGQKQHQQKQRAHKGLPTEGCASSRILEIWPGSCFLHPLPGSLGQPGAGLQHCLGDTCFFGLCFPENISLVCCWTPVIPALRRARKIASSSRPATEWVSGYPVK